jgi:sugar phosphate isomerase/epimerase
MITRRDFIQSAAAALGAACAHSKSTEVMLANATKPLRSDARLPIGFSTLGCPRWEWGQVLDFASTHGYAAVELRGLLAEMDLTTRPEFAAAQLDQTQRQIADHGLRISCLGASANMHETDVAKRATAMAEGRRFIDLAHALHARYVRVFGNKYSEGIPRDQMLARIAGGLRELGDYAGERGVTVLLESHGDFTDSPTLRELMERANSSAVAMLWDAHHTFVFGKEQPEDTVQQLGRWIRHTHLKDSVPSGTDRRYVLTGTGEVPVRRQIESLVRVHYTGFYSFEWEKRWHPEIEEPEIAFAQFADVASAYLRSAGVRAT